VLKTIQFFCIDIPLGISQYIGNEIVLYKKIHRKAQSLQTDVIMPFSAAKVEGISTDTTRKILHRLHDNGVITIVKKGYFKKEESFSVLLFVYGSLKKGFDNHNLLSKYAKRLGKAHTVKNLQCLKTLLETTLILLIFQSRQ